MNKATRNTESCRAAVSLVTGKTFRQFMYFAAVGAVGTVGQYLTLMALVETHMLKPVPASVIGFAVGAVINYFLNYHLTFSSDKPHIEAMSKFFTVAIIGAVINTALMYVGNNLLQLYYLLPQVFATGLVLLWNFLANKLWTFKQV